MTDIYKCEVNTRPPRIAYRETITAPAEGHHRHKKQTGGAGQFGEVFLRVEPLPRGAGFEFVDQVTGGAIPYNFMHAVEKGVRKALVAAVQAARPSVLEPIVNVEIAAPEQNIGDITGDLASRRGQVSGTTSAPNGL